MKNLIVMIAEEVTFCYDCLMDFSSIITAIAQSLPGFLMAIVVHEYAHGYVALRFGDTTARDAGRLSFNPAVHYDPIGTVVFPLIGIMLGGLVFGWARPVPINLRNVKEANKGLFWISFAGPLANFILGTICAFLWAFINLKVPNSFGLKAQLAQMLSYAVIINFFLGGFNLIPLPPLDGSKMVSSMLSYNAQRKYEEIARYTPMIFMVIIALSLMGIRTIGYVLMPFFAIASFISDFFYRILL